MNIFNFDTSKMTWEKTTITGTGTSIVSIKISDEQYFKSLENLFLNLRNNIFKLVLIKKSGGESFIFGDVNIVNWDFINNKPKINTVSHNNLKINVQLLVPTASLTNINDYWLYLQYE